MKKIFCILIAICMLLGVGCNSVSTNYSNVESTVTLPNAEESNRVMSLLYSYSDSFNPYLAKTTANREIAGLLYDCLVKTDNQFNVKYVLAQSVEIKEKLCTVNLRDAKFSDGSPLTADDVVYSYNLAKECIRYMHNFYEVVSVSAADSKTVVFTLSQHDPYFVNLLDFPIVKVGTSGSFDSDGKEIYPVGCGRYVISADGQSLEVNNNYFGKKGSIEKIKLINSPDAASTTHYVEIGATAMYYTDSGDIVRMSGKKTTVNLNRLVYIGINQSYGSLQTKEMRHAISSAIDREKICQTAYYNNAVSATGFFNPYFEPARAHQTIENKPNNKITVENLSKIGYNSMNSNGYYANTAGNNPVFSLLVNSENDSRVAAAKAIAQQCAAAGIQINVIECTYAQYVERLSSGSFQLYLGEIQLLDNMDFTQLVVAGGSAAYGVAENKTTTETPEAQPDAEQPLVKESACKAILNSYHAGQCSISDVAGTLLTEMPQIPVCYLNGVLFYNDGIKGDVVASSSDIYFNFENYEF